MGRFLRHSVVTVVDVCRRLSSSSVTHMQRNSPGTARGGPVVLRTVRATRYLIRSSRRRQTSPPMPPPCKPDETCALSLILAHSICYVKTWRHPENKKYIKYCTAIRGGPSHGHQCVRGRFFPHVLNPWPLFVHPLCNIYGSTVKINLYCVSKKTFHL